MVPSVQNDVGMFYYKKPGKIGGKNDSKSLIDEYILEIETYLKSIYIGFETLKSTQYITN